MKCEQARTAIIEELTGDAGPGVSTALRAHLSSCAACRSLQEQISTVWIGLETIRAPELPNQRAEAMLARLQGVGGDHTIARKGSASTTARRRMMLTAALLAAAFLGAILSRTEIAMRLVPVSTAGTETASSFAPPLPPDAGLYLFLLHRPEQANAPGRGARYQQWADDLRARGLLVRAEALQSTWGWRLTPTGTDFAATPMPQPAGDIEGFFMIAASDSVDVLTAARLSPHFGYGGVIEVRRVAATSTPPPR